MATFLHTPSTHPHMPSSALSLSTTPKKKAMDRCLEDILRTLDAFLSPQIKNLFEKEQRSNHNLYNHDRNSAELLGLQAKQLKGKLEHFQEQLQQQQDTTPENFSIGQKRSRRSVLLEDPNILELQRLRTELEAKETIIRRMNFDFEKQTTYLEDQISRWRQRSSMVLNEKRDDIQQLENEKQDMKTSEKDLKEKLQYLNDKEKYYENQSAEWEEKAADYQAQIEDLYQKLELQETHHKDEIMRFKHTFTTQLEKEAKLYKKQIEILIGERDLFQFRFQESEKRVPEAQQVLERAQDIRTCRQESEQLKAREQQLIRKIQKLETNKKDGIIQDEKITSLMSKLNRSEQRVEQLLDIQRKYELLERDKNEWRQLFAPFFNDASSSSTLSQMFEESPARAAVLLYKDSQAKEILLMETQERTKIKKNQLEKKVSDYRQELKKVEHLSEEQQIQILEKEEQLSNALSQMKVLQHQHDDLHEFIKTYDRELYHQSSSSKGNLSELEASRINHLELSLQSAQKEISRLQQQQQQAVFASPASNKKTAKTYQQRLLRNEKELETSQQSLKFLEVKNEELEQEIAEMKHRLLVGDYIPAKTKILHFVNNPQSQVQNQVKDQKIYKLEQEILHLQQESSSSMSSSFIQHTPSLSTSTKVTASAVKEDYKKQYDVLLKTFKEKQKEFRENIYLLLGYKVYALNDLPSGEKLYRLRSMFAEDEEDDLEFSITSDGRVQVMETPFMNKVQTETKEYLYRMHSIPAFISQVTLDLFEQQTFQIQ